MADGKIVQVIEGLERSSTLQPRTMIVLASLTLLLGGLVAGSTWLSWRETKKRNEIAVEANNTAVNANKIARRANRLIAAQVKLLRHPPAPASAPPPAESATKDRARGHSGARSTARERSKQG